MSDIAHTNSLWFAIGQVTAYASTISLEPKAVRDPNHLVALEELLEAGEGWCNDLIDDMHATMSVAPPDDFKANWPSLMDIMNARRIIRKATKRVDHLFTRINYQFEAR